MLENENAGLLLRLLGEELRDFGEERLPQLLGDIGRVLGMLEGGDARSSQALSSASDGILFARQLAGVGAYEESVLLAERTLAHLSANPGELR